MSTQEKLEEILPLFYERKGFRELCWCPNLNEPVILTYRHEKGKPTLTICENCGSTDEEYIKESHPFIGSVKKTYVDRTDVINRLLQLIDSAKREVLEQIRPPQATIDSMKLTQPHKYRGVEYPCCSICGYCPEAINAFIDSQLEQSEESE